MVISTKMKTFVYPNLYMLHRVLEQEGGLTNYTKRSDTVRLEISKTIARIQKFYKYDPPKVRFSKILNSVICPNMGGGQGSGPSHPDGVGPLGVIC